ncbi:uncharacterized protein LOC111081912 isoform X2 [Drosophila obscura]|uniref:uncharacterized protein LOC111081912 isoform X2 n=1 Tax=Drosophila obscura TaxID=7282 RepID=UPI001BB1856C|nr:uncharacterized protein LOC111081912 isoform X2 [Drosophila obscura]
MLKSYQKNSSKCIISSCRCGYRNSPKASPIRLFSFPSDPILFNKWIESCNLDSKMVKKTARICDRHFEPELLGKVRLRPESVPTLNLSLLTPLNASICDENTFSDHTVDNTPIENLKRIKLADVDNNNKMSNEFEQESETETSDEDPLQNDDLIDFEFCESDPIKKLSANQKDHRNAGHKCIISSCRIGYRDSLKDSPVRLFSFPTFPFLLNKWIEACNLDKEMIKKTSRICERHFEANCVGKRRLKSKAIPTLNIPDKTMLTPLNASTCDANTLSGNTVDNKQTEKRIEITVKNVSDLQNKNSNELEQVSQTEMPSGDPLENNKSKDIKLCILPSGDPLENNNSKDIKLCGNEQKKDNRKSSLKCSISNCRLGYRNSPKDSPARLFTFPSDLLFFDKWIDVCKLDRNLNRRTARICERHFEDKYLGKLRLKHKAIPTLNLPDKPLLTPLNASTCDENTLSGNTADNNLADLQYTNSNESEFETDEDPFENNESNSMELCENEQKKDNRKSGHKCIISSCVCGYRNSSTNLPVRLFSFPSEPLLLNKWVGACNLNRNMVKRTSRICERHFESEWFGKLRLKSQAIPTLKLPDDTRLTPSNASIYDENSCSGNSVDNEPIERQMPPLRLIENNTISTEIPDKDPLENNESIDTECCKNCIEKEQTESYYRKKCFELLADKQKKEEDFNKLKKRFRDLRKAVSRKNTRRRTRALSNYNVLPLIASMPNVSTEVKTICTMLLKKTTTFTPAEKVIAQNINFYSSRTYKYLRDVLHLNLPTERSLERWAVRFGPGFSPDLLGTSNNFS